jgi:hypothetical protein
LNVHENRIIVHSRTISNSPLTKRKLESFRRSLILVPYKNADVPARNTKVGTQKWVTHLVKKIPGVAPQAGTPEYTRTWSIAINTMTRPRNRSSDRTLVLIVKSKG